jgi:hypothetical protein
MVNSGEALLNVVTKGQAKDADSWRTALVVSAEGWLQGRLGPKGMWAGPGAPNSPGAVGGPPAKKRDLPQTVTPAKRGKPVVSPTG